MLLDLLFVEGRVRLPHLGLLALALPLLFLTRSRVALLSLVVSLSLVYFNLPRKIVVDQRMKKWLGHILLVGGVALMVVVVFAEIKGNTISRWMRKTDNVQADQRSLSEALTASRQGVMEMCMDDFRRNPLLGMGFQVAEYTRLNAEQSKGLILSSPIEKGVIPVMVLGETGIVGAIIFGAFLLAFYKGCSEKRLYITLTMMTVFLTINMGEATFFSPGGIGGVEWVICIIGGYVLDMLILSKEKYREYWI